MMGIPVPGSLSLQGGGRTSLNAIGIESASVEVRACVACVFPVVGAPVVCDSLVIPLIVFS